MGVNKKYYSKSLCTLAKCSSFGSAVFPWWCGETTTPHIVHFNFSKYFSISLGFSAICFTSWSIDVNELQEDNKIKMKGMEDRLESLEALLKEQNKRTGISSIERYSSHELYSMQARNWIESRSPN